MQCCCMCSIYRGAELRRASPAPDSLVGRIAYRLLVVCALRSCPKSNFTAPGRVSSIVAGTGSGTLRYQRAVAACRQVCQRTNVPKNQCAAAVSQRSSSRRSHFSSRTAPLGKRHWAAPLSGDSTALPASPGGPLPSARNSKTRRHGLDRCGFIRTHEVKGPGLAVAGLAVADGAPFRREGPL